MMLDAKGLEVAAKATFAKANEGNLKPETIESLWPSQHLPHWSGLAEAAITAYLQVVEPEPAVAVKPLIERVAATSIWHDIYPNGPDMMNGGYSVTPDDVRACRSALVATPPAERVTDAWCQPMNNGEHQPRKFIVRFEDADRGEAVFDDEREARSFWERANTNWNCYLFGAMPLAAKPTVKDDETVVETDWINYRPLAEGKIIQGGDECLTDSHLGWQPAANTVGSAAPDPLYTAHRMYRRPIAAKPAVKDDERVVEALRELLGFARALEKQGSMGTGGRRGGAIFAKAEAALVSTKDGRS